MQIYTMQTLEGTCPNSGCSNQLYFTSNTTESVECFKCGQLHDSNKILNVKPVSDSIHSFLKTVQKYKAELLKKNREKLRVKRLSNYSSKLISPLLTKYGLDKGTQEVKLLSTMGQGSTFDCSHLSNRVFMIEGENLDVPEYGRDNAADYLQDTLKEILFVNGNEERLVPIYADGDGHCLLHAISRALVGRELFWHPLLTNLKFHFTQRQSDYKALLGDFIQDSEWSEIIKEADPNYLPAYGETHGLRNIHVFGLANVLHRPIILIDSLEGMRSKGDYCGVFVPALAPFEKCKGADGRLNKPIVIAWSSKGHNHFVPLVGIKGKPVPRYPSYLLPKIWGLAQELLPHYIELEEQTCVIGGSKTLSEAYLSKLVGAMDNHYRILNGVAPSVVTDVYQYIYKPSGVVGMTSQMVMEAAFALVKEERLHKCLSCSAVSQQDLPCSLSSLEPGGKLYELAMKTQGPLKDGCQYKFPLENTVCKYDKAKNKLLLVRDVIKMKCKDCGGSLRLIKRDGGVVYFNGDQVTTPASADSHCGCGYKHYWDGKEYDNLPIKIPVFMEWNGIKKEDIVYWFQNESDASNNSNAFELAQKVVHKHFPGEFGSERVVQKVVDQIFRETLKNKVVPKNVGLPPQPKSEGSESLSPSSKIILTGAKSKTIHKEELNVSKKEQIIRSKIEHGAVAKQKRMSSSPNKQAKQFLGSVPNEKGVDIPVSVSNKKVESNIPKARRIRISTVDKGNSMYTLSDETSYNDIQTFIEDTFKIDRESQIIKYGFPLKILTPFDGDKLLPVNLKHGERLTVHVKKVEPADVSMEIENLDKTNSEDDVSGKGNYFDDLLLGDRSEREVNTDDLASSLFSLLETVDLWSCACTQRSMFQKNGIFYSQAFKDLDSVVDNKHFTLPCFPNKLFAYNQEADEVFLCLGKTHIPVQPLSPELTDLAHKQMNEAVRPDFSESLPKKIILPRQDERGFQHVNAPSLQKDKKELLTELRSDKLEERMVPDSNDPPKQSASSLTLASSDLKKDNTVIPSTSNNTTYNIGEIYSNDEKKEMMEKLGEQKCVKNSSVGTSPLECVNDYSNKNMCDITEERNSPCNEPDGDEKHNGTNENIGNSSIDNDIVGTSPNRVINEIEIKDGENDSNSGATMVVKTTTIHDEFHNKMDIDM